MMPAQYHQLDHPEKGVGLHYSLFTPLYPRLPQEIIDEKK